MEKINEELTMLTIASRLSEKDLGFIESMVRILGHKKALDLLVETQNIEKAGGMLTNDGSRRRTPGGVFGKLAREAIQLKKKGPSQTKVKLV